MYSEMELEIVDMEDETTASADNNMAFAFEIVTVEMGDNTSKTASFMRKHNCIQLYPQELEYIIEFKITLTREVHRSR